MVSAKQLGERLVQARQRMGQTREQLADSLGITPASLMSMEKGEQRPSNIELLKLARQLEISLNELLREHTLFMETGRLSRSDEHLALKAYAQEHLSEGELARYLHCDRVTARDLLLSMEDANGEPR